MPTTQFSPRPGDDLRSCSDLDSPPTLTPEPAAAPKVPYSQTSLELSGRKARAESHAAGVASCASSARQTTMAPPVVSEWENGGRNVANAQSQLAAGSPKQLQRPDGSHRPKPAGSILPPEEPDLMVRGKASLQQSSRLMVSDESAFLSPELNS